MINLIASLMINCCLISGVLLRYVPFANVITQKQKYTLRIAYVTMFVFNFVSIYMQISDKGLSLKISKGAGVLFAVFTAIINMVIIRGRLREHLFVAGISMACNYVIMTVPSFIVVRMGGFDSTKNYMIATVIYGVLLLICYHPIRWLLKKTVEPFLYIDTGSYWNTIWFIPIAMFCSMVLAFPGETLVTNIYQLLSGGFSASVMILMCLSIAQDYERLGEKAAMEAALVSQKIHYARLQTKVEDVRKTSHDFKHSIAAISQLARANDLEGIREYCSEWILQNEKDAHIPYTGNVAVDGVLYRYMELAKENDIEFKYVGTIHSGKIADMDLCVLLGNALENAFEACMYVATNRSIHVVAQSEEHLLSIVVHNSFDGTVIRSGDIILSRKRKNSGGIGFSSMKSVCERYGGAIETKWDEKTFTILFMIPIVSS